MRSLRRWAFGALTVAALAVVAACGSEGSDDSGSTATAAESGSVEVESKKIGVVAAALAAPIERASLDVLEKAGAEFGYEIDISDANNDPEKMLAAANAYATQDVDAVILASVDPQVVTPALNRLKQSDTPVLVINGQQPPSDLVTAQYVENEKELGAATAELMTELVPNAKVGEIESSLFTGAQRAAGLREVLEGPKGNGAEIVASVEPDLANLVPATTKGVTDLLTANSDINVIYSVFDTFLEPASAALRSKGSDAKMVTMYLEPVTYEALSDPNDPLIGVVNVDLGVTAAVAIDQLVNHFENDEPIDPDAMEEHPLTLTGITRENLPSSVDEFNSATKILKPFREEWEKEYGSE